MLTYKKQEAPQTLPLQTKLKVGAANDPMETEADRVADQVMRMPQKDQPIQRKCQDCEEEDIQMMPQESTTNLIQRKTPFHEKKREFADDSQIPAKFNYELKSHKLIAHTVSNKDVDTILGMIRILSLYSGVVIDEKALRQQLTDARGKAKEGDRIDIDVTGFLPQAVQNFMSGLEAYYEGYRKHVAENGPRDKIFEDMPDFTPERTAKLGEWDNAGPSRTMPDKYDLWHAVCHEFAMITMGGAAKGEAKKGASGPDAVDDEATTNQYDSSLQGKGPFRKVTDSEVQVGDIAVFKAGKKIPAIPNGIIHSAVVIKVGDGEVELLEKKNPLSAMATRTVGEVLKKYAGEKARVHYLSPAFAGMPTEKTKDLGGAPPSEDYDEARNTSAKDQEHSHVLFQVDSNLLRAHEDIKLFQFVLGQKGQTVQARIHGYSSEEGGDDYNFNLSAHRAVNVKKALLGQLSGASIDAIAHGETSAFGDRAQNRRAGIELLSSPSGGGSGGSEPGSDTGASNTDFQLPDFNWTMGQPFNPLDIPLSPITTTPPLPCTRLPTYPDFPGLLQQVRCDIFQNLEDNAHHFSRLQILFPDRPDLQEEAFLRYFTGTNLLETTATFFGADSPWSDIIVPYGAGLGLKTFTFLNSGELILDIQVPIGGFTLELSGEIQPESDDGQTDSSWQFQSGLIGTW